MKAAKGDQRAWLEHRLGPIPDAIWAWLEDRALTHSDLPEDLTTLEEEAKEGLRLWSAARADRAPQPRRRRRTQRPVPEPTGPSLAVAIEQATAPRARAVAAYVFRLASADLAVRRFRAEVLNGWLLDFDETVRFLMSAPPDRFWRLRDRLSQDYGWSVNDAQRFLLSGYRPLFMPIQARCQRHKLGHVVLQLEVADWVQPEALAKAMRRLQLKGFRRTKPVTLELFEFVLDRSRLDAKGKPRPEQTWAAMQVEWNRGRPPADQFSNWRTMSRDFGRAIKTLMPTLSVGGSTADQEGEHVDD